MCKGLGIASAVWNEFGQELVVTSAMDGTHSDGSLHPSGNAADLRTNYFAPAIRKDVKARLEEKLGPDFDVVLHPDHMHMEYDPKSI